MYEENPVEKFARYLREEFEARLQAKTGWGRNEILQQYDQASTAATMRMMREAITK